MIDVQDAAGGERIHVIARKESKAMESEEKKGGE